MESSLPPQRNTDNSIPAARNNWSIREADDGEGERSAGWELSTAAMLGDPHTSSLDCVAIVSYRQRWAVFQLNAFEMCIYFSLFCNLHSAGRRKKEM